MSVFARRIGSVLAAAVSGVASLAMLAGCGQKIANRSPVGEVFPSVPGEGLDKKKWRIPEDMAGKDTLLLIGYDQDTQFDIDRWMLGILQVKTPVVFYELPTIPGLGAAVMGGMIDDGMRAGIPKDLWGGVITVYGGAEKIVRFTGNERRQNSRVALLDGSGRVIWFWDQGFSPKAMLELDGLVRERAGSGGR